MSNPLFAATAHPRRLCADCGVNTLPTEWSARAEWYVVTDDVWHAAGMGDRGFLCIRCLTERLGRDLTRADFEDVPLNDPEIYDLPRLAWSFRTPRLQRILEGS